MKALAATVFITTIFVFSVQNSHAKDSDSIPLTFTSGKWISADDLDEEKNICSGQEINSDEDFFIEFKQNSYSMYGWEWEEHAKVISLNKASPTVLKGKVKATSKWMGDTEVEDRKIDFFIKDGRLYSKIFGEKVKKYGMYHCL